MNARIRDPELNPGAQERAARTAANDASLGTLIRDLAHEAPALLRDEVELAKLEAREALEQAQRATAAAALGGAVATSGFIVLLLSAVYGLSLYVQPWLAALLVGGFALLVGLAMVQSGRKAMSPDALKPERTLDSLRRDKDALRGRTP